MKIFGIGLNKTGTSTLGAAGKIFALRVKTWDAKLFKDAIVDGSRAQLWDTIENHDLFNDFPYSLLYEEIHARYPEAKFILTVRNSPQTWLNSVKRHSMRAGVRTNTHRNVYGYRFPHGREGAFLTYYENHNNQAREYFRQFPENFLEIAWEDERDFTRLAEFLGREVPSDPIPHANKSTVKRVNPLRYGYNVVARWHQFLQTL